MKSQIIRLPDKTCFLFGARCTGKSTLLMALCDPKITHYIGLLDLRVEQRWINSQWMEPLSSDGLRPSFIWKYPRVCHER